MLAYVLKEDEMIKLKIKGMSCNHCKNRVEKALNAVEGVEKAVVDLDKGLALIQLRERRVEVKELIDAVVDAGYEAEAI